MRISRDQALMSTAHIWSKRSTCNRKQVGAVISRDGRIISQGYNGAPSGMPHCTPETCNDKNPCDNTIHAEINAILFAAKHGISTQGSTIHTTLEPCLNCARAIVNAGITEVVYGESYRSHEGLEYLLKAGIYFHQFSL